MDTFANEAEFWHTVNQWVRDGSNIYAVSDGPTWVSVYLVGKDGCHEVLQYIYQDEEE